MYIQRHKEKKFRLKLFTHEFYKTLNQSKVVQFLYIKAEYKKKTERKNLISELKIT